MVEPFGAGLLCFSFGGASRALLILPPWPHALVQRIAYAGDALFFLRLAIWPSAMFGWIIGGRRDKPVSDWTELLIGKSSGHCLVGGGRPGDSVHRN